MAEIKNENQLLKTKVISLEVLLNEKDRQLREANSRLANSNADSSLDLIIANMTKLIET